MSEEEERMFRTESGTVVKLTERLREVEMWTMVAGHDSCSHTVHKTPGTQIHAQMGMVQEVRTENGLRHVRDHEDPLVATEQTQADSQNSRTVCGDPCAVDGAEEDVG